MPVSWYCAAEEVVPETVVGGPVLDAASETSARPRKPPHRILLWVGVVSIASGVALLAYVAWQLVGTNIVSHHRQQQLIEQLHDEWNQPSGGSAARQPRPGEPTAVVRIPRFGSDYAVPLVEGVTDDALASGLGHFSDTAAPGEPGNFAMAGHRITHGEPLRDMPDLRPGDLVEVETRNVTYTYVIDTDPEDLVVSYSDTWVLNPHPVNPDPAGVQPADNTHLLTMATCAELFHSDDRMVLFGHLVGHQSHPR